MTLHPFTRTLNLYHQLECVGADLNPHLSTYDSGHTYIIESCQEQLYRLIYFGLLAIQRLSQFISNWHYYLEAGRYIATLLRD